MAGNEYFSLTPASLKQQGIKAVLTDLDNTLMAWDHPEGTAKLTQWLSDLRNGGIQVVVVSNNNANRIHKAMAKLQV
ncbi:HAD superfamily hydrolase, partial [Lacticaseibacillus rhamnosus MTCC 5462]